VAAQLTLGSLAVSTTWLTTLAVGECCLLQSAEADGSYITYVKTVRGWNDTVIGALKVSKR
jgi:hypothetical protein